MPEGDTVYRAAAQLRGALVGAELTRFELRVPRHGAADLRGQVVDEVASVGKHLLVRIGPYTLHNHLKMEGRWHVYRAGQKWRAPGFKARAVLGTAEVEAVGFELAEVRLVPRGDEGRLIGHLGPDVLSPAWGAEEEAAALANLVADGRALHVAVQDQRNVAGFGNEYASEICFLAGIDPRRAACDADVERALRVGRKAILANRDRQPRSTTGDPRRGRRLFVYGRAGQPCLRCGQTIRRTTLGASELTERIVFWCPRCQV